MNSAAPNWRRTPPNPKLKNVSINRSSRWTWLVLSWPHLPPPTHRNTCPLGETLMVISLFPILWVDWGWPRQASGPQYVDAAQGGPTFCRCLKELRTTRASHYYLFQQPLYETDGPTSGYRRLSAVSRKRKPIGPTERKNRCRPVPFLVSFRWKLCSVVWSSKSTAGFHCWPCVAIWQLPYFWCVSLITSSLMCIVWAAGSRSLGLRPALFCLWNESFFMSLLLGSHQNSSE